jgi:Flp pilus assembly pilin Flp
MHVTAYVSFIIRRYAGDKVGAVAVEYAFLAAFVAIVAAVGIALVIPSLQGFFVDTGAAVEGAGSGNFTNDPSPPYQPSS